eukprot:683317-Pelagomonas_calceolata.AAC.7
MDKRKTLLTTLGIIAFLMLASVTGRQLSLRSSSRNRYLSSHPSSRQSSVSVMAGIRHCVLLKLKDNSPEVVSRVRSMVTHVWRCRCRCRGHVACCDLILLETPAQACMHIKANLDKLPALIPQIKQVFQPKAGASKSSITEMIGSDSYSMLALFAAMHTAMML